MKTTQWMAISMVMMALAGFSPAFAANPGTACTASGTVTGVCNGVSGYPVKFDSNSPTGVSPLCPPYNNPFVVFSPHPDDETLAMAGVIREAKAAGRKVIVELMTNGDQSGLCVGSQGTSGDCGKNRCREFMAAMVALGVDGVTVNNFGDKTLLTNGNFGCPADPSQAVPVAAKVPQRVQFWMGMRGTSAINGCLSLRGTVGYEDGNESGLSICHPDHLAVRLALKNANHADTKWYAVYVHADPNRFNTTSGIPGTFNHESIQAWCNAGVLAALNSYMTPNPTTIGYNGAQGAFNNEKSDCLGGVAEDYSLKDPFTSCFVGGGGTCGEASCVPPDGEYISHFTGPNCDGTESYYLPYDGWAYQCRPYPSSGARCGTMHRTVTNYSYRYAGQCYPNAWPNGNTLTDFVTVYR